MGRMVGETGVEVLPLPSSPSLRAPASRRLLARAFSPLQRGGSAVATRSVEVPFLEMAPTSPSPSMGRALAGRFSSSKTYLFRAARR